MKKGIRMTREQVEAHQRRHGFIVDAKKGIVTGTAEQWKKGFVLKDEMNKTERDYSYILEARKRRGEIDEFRFQGMTLRWRDLASGELMRYTPDFVVYDVIMVGPLGDQSRALIGTGVVKLHFIEIKGGWIKGKLERAVERFRHARTVHPQFAFEMHQKKGGSWQRIH